MLGVGIGSGPTDGTAGGVTVGSAGALTTGVGIGLIAAWGDLGANDAGLVLPGCGFCAGCTCCVT